MTAEERITHALQQMATCYPRFTLSKATLAQYVKYLADEDIDQLERACRYLPRTSTFFPSIAEIITHMHPQEPAAPGPRITGYRFTRGTHGGQYVRDPEGTDHVPDWYDA